MKIVLDTNCLIISIQEYSRHHWLWQAFRDEKIVLCYTNEILSEYYEVLSRYYSVPFADGVVEEILGTANAKPVTVYYSWNLITADPDDNKFVDCAISANAKYIVSNDRHFKILENIDFPKVNISTMDEFKKIIQT
jgi:putative PIN family toxin of toxin-antitoxin system